MRLSKLALATAFIAACSSGDDGGTNVSKQVTSATGGTVQVGTTGASLAIPAQALSADTMITVTAASPQSNLPQPSTVHGLYYDFGPDGTTFAQPAALSLPVAGTPAAGASVVISWYDGASWVDLPTTVSAGVATAEVAHFTGFVVRYLTGTGTTVSCEDVKAPCGGDVVGTWSPSTVCGLKEIALPPNCPDSSVVVADDLSGSAIFTGSGYTANLASTETLTGTVSAACLANNEVAGCADAQAHLRASDESSKYPSLLNVICTPNSANGCSCSGTGSGTVADESGTYTASGTDLNMTDSSGHVESPKGYCVDGTTLWLETDHGSGEVIAFTR